VAINRRTPGLAININQINNEKRALLCVARKMLSDVPVDMPELIAEQTGQRYRFIGTPTLTIVTIHA